MRQTATYAAPSPWRDIGWQLLLWVAFFVVTCLIDWSCTAHAGERQLITVINSPSLKHTRRMTRITVLRPARVTGRARAGFPFRQSVASTTLAIAYGAGTAYRVSGLIPNPNGILANILFPRW